MHKLEDDYYYLLGRKMAIVEFNGKIPRTLPHGITTSQMADWRLGYNEMHEGLHWRRKPVKEQSDNDGVKNAS